MQTARYAPKTLVFKSLKFNRCVTVYSELLEISHYKVKVRNNFSGLAGIAASPVS